MLLIFTYVSNYDEKIYGLKIGDFALKIDEKIGVHGDKMYKVFVKNKIFWKYQYDFYEVK